MMNLISLSEFNHMMMHLYIMLIFKGWQMTMASNLMILFYQKNNNKSIDDLLEYPVIIKDFLSIKSKWKQANSIRMKKIILPSDQERIILLITQNADIVL